MRKAIKRMFSLLFSLVFVFSFAVDSLALVLTEYDIGLPLEDETVAPQNNMRIVTVSNLSDPVEIQEGQFFIKSRASNENTGLNYFLRDLDYFSVVGESFYSIDSQKWQLIDAGDGYYRIMNVNSKKYLTAPSSSSSLYAELKPLYSTESGNTIGQIDGQLWMFTKTDASTIYEPAYKIQPKIYVESNGASPYYLSLNETQGFYGHDAVLEPYYNDANFFDEWYLVTYEQSITLYYDLAFEAMMQSRNYSVSTKLFDMANLASETFFRTIGVQLFYNTTIKMTSTPDRCVITNQGVVNNSNRIVKCPSNPTMNSSCEICESRDLAVGHISGCYAANSEDSDKTCNCNKDCKSWSQIAADFITASNPSKDRVPILFTGHQLHNYQGEQCNRSYRVALSNGASAISMQTYYSSPVTYYNNETDTLIHEIAHHFGAPDHYHEIDSVTGECKNKDICSNSDCSGANGRSSECFMSGRNVNANNISAMQTEYLFCEDCIEDMRAFFS